MNLREWLLDLAENNRWDIIEGEVVILPIEEDIIGCQSMREGVNLYKLCFAPLYIGAGDKGMFYVAK